MKSALAAVATLVIGCAPVAVDPDVEFETNGGTLRITIGGQPFAEYVFDDGTVSRPYFSNVFSPAGIKATRNHPTESGDESDHPHHTGIFLTFGSLNGVDYWHGRGCETAFVRFLEEPGGGTFVAEYEYRGPDGKAVLGENSRHTIRVTQHGYLIDYDGTFTAAVDCTFGSKEEGGMAARVATPIAVDSKKGGRLVDSKGRSGGDVVWGKRAAWVDYSDANVGMTIMSNPENFSGEPWWHARDYGLFAANPFGPLNDGEATFLPKGETLRLRYGVMVHSGGGYDAAEAFAEYVSR